VGERETWGENKLFFIKKSYFDKRACEGFRGPDFGKQNYWKKRRGGWFVGRGSDGGETKQNWGNGGGRERESCVEVGRGKRRKGIALISS